MRWLATLVALVSLAAPAAAAVPGGIDITCDVPRSGTPNFRGAAVGQTAVTFKLWSAASGGSQIGTDYSVPMTNLAVAKRYTDNYDSVRPRKAARINATIGSDDSPVVLPVDGKAWLEVAVGAATFGCDFAATGDPATRRRLQSVAFAREGGPTPADISARVRNSSSLAISHNTPTVLTFDTTKWDTDGLKTSGSKLAAPTGGKYLIFAHVAWAYGAGDSERRIVRLKRNGSEFIASVGQNAVTGPANPQTEQSVSTHYELAQNDYVEVEVVQQSGSTLNVDATGPNTPEFGMVKLP